MNPNEALVQAVNQSSTTLFLFCSICNTDSDLVANNSQVNFI